MKGDIMALCREVDSLRIRIVWAGREEKTELERQLVVAERNLKAARDARNKEETNS